MSWPAGNYGGRVRKYPDPPPRTARQGGKIQKPELEWQRIKGRRRYWGLKLKLGPLITKQKEDEMDKKAMEWLKAKGLR
jgi:hypothetical protein